MSARLPWEKEGSSAPVGGQPERDHLAAEDHTPDPLPESLGGPGDDLREALTNAAEEVSASTSKAVGEVIAAQARGQEVVISTVNMSGQKIKVADAKQRAFRTLFQNLLVDCLVALGTVVPMLLSMRFDDPAAWAVFGTSVAKTVVTVFVSYVSRLSVDPVIPTPVETSTGAVVQPIPHAKS